MSNRSFSQIFIKKIEFPENQNTLKTHFPKIILKNILYFKGFTLFKILIIPYNPI
jgi:hypothetical protein